MQTPDRYHTASRHPGDAADCWECGRQAARCRAKLRFTSWAEADDWVTEYNVSTGYVQPVVRYRCSWCLGWHMKTAKGRVDRGRAEKQRRKWIIVQEQGRRDDRP